MFSRKLTAFLLSIFACSASWADAQPGQGYFSPMATYIDDDPLRAVNDETAGGQLGLGIVLSDRWNLEGIVQFADLQGPGQQEQFGVGIDLQTVFNRAGRLSPYLFVGIGYLEVDPVAAPKSDGGMYAAGAGMNIDMFGDSGVALRAEYRYRADDALAGQMNDQLFSLGLQIPFGSERVVILDSDNDGVMDANDRCPNTPAGIQVDATGCEADADKDGVVDSLDQCPKTRPNATVDARGCERDSDGDGVADSADSCPNTVAGATVNARGCELDDDGDKVVNRLDRCPNTRAGAQVDVHGCEIKEEINLPGVTFETNSDRLLPGAERVLDNAAATLMRNPTITVEVAGHTDSDGSAAYNESLSERRAATVRDYLNRKGVPMDRMTVRGYGEAEPIAPNTTAAGKAQNRRVVLRITSR